MEDASPRLLRTLAEADLVVAEDTRVLRRLASALGLRLRRVASTRGARAIEPSAIQERLRRGERVVVVSDAGMPNTADPGAVLVAAARAIGARITVVPGPSAATAAMALWPHEVSRFNVAGFLPRQPRRREQVLREIVGAAHPTVIFEAPGRVTATVAAIARLDPDRELLLAKELTKLHETSALLVATDAASWLASSDLRGEWTIVVAGAPPCAAPTESIPLAALIEALAHSPIPAPHAARVLAELSQRPRRWAYEELRRQRPGSGLEPR